MHANKEVEKVNEFLSIQIPNIHHKDIVPLYKDGDESNLDPDNVTYRFKDGPIECVKFPGYYYVPGFSRYALSKDGELINVETGMVRKWTRMVSAKASIRGGYVHAPCVDEYGRRKMPTRHRLMCITFLDYDFHPSSRIINHINGIGGDDRIENLEFCTYQENTKHAYDLGLYANKTVPVDVYNWNTGFEHRFPSLATAANWMKLTESTVKHRLDAGNNKRHPDGWRVKNIDEPWLSLDDYSRIDPNNRSVLCRNIFSNEEFSFPTIAMAASHTGMPTMVIRSHCDIKAKAPLRGWNFRFSEDFRYWPTYTERQLEIFKTSPVRPGNGILVHNLINNEELFFVTVSEAGDYFRLSPITISKMAREKKIWKRQYRFDYILVSEDF